MMQTTLLSLIVFGYGQSFILYVFQLLTFRTKKIIES